MFGHFLLEQGMELELRADMEDVLDFVDHDIPRFVCGNYGYKISSGKGVIDSGWKLLVKSWDLETSKDLESPVGYIEMKKLDDQTTSFKIPPRVARSYDDGTPSNQDIRLFASFIFQTLNSFQERGYIQLPGLLPVE